MRPDTSTLVQQVVKDIREEESVDSDLDIDSEEDVAAAVRVRGMASQFHDSSYIKDESLGIMRYEEGLWKTSVSVSFAHQNWLLQIEGDGAGAEADGGGPTDFQREVLANIRDNEEFVLSNIQAALFGYYMDGCERWRDDLRRILSGERVEAGEIERDVDDSIPRIEQSEQIWNVVTPLTIVIPSQNVGEHDKLVRFEVDPRWNQDDTLVLEMTGLEVKRIRSMLEEEEAEKNSDRPDQEEDAER